MNKTPDTNWFVISLWLVIIGKIIWDWFVSGRIQKEPPYVLNEKCEEYRNKCCGNEIKKGIIETNIKVDMLEKRSDEDKADLKELRKDFNEMNLKISNMDGNIEQIKNFVVGTHKNGSK